jgi:hypothetical protein
MECPKSCWEMVMMKYQYNGKIIHTYHTMKLHRIMEVKFHASLILVVDETGCKSHTQTTLKVELGLVYVW